MSLITSRHVGSMAAVDFKVGPADKSVKAIADVVPTLENYGAIGDGVADDTAAVAAAITAADGRRIFGKSKKFYVTTAYTDVYGADFDDDIIVHAPGAKPVASYATRQHILGKEYLHGWYQNLANRVPMKVVFSGDSTTASGMSHPFRVDDLLREAAVATGIDFLTVYNNGHSGHSCEEWVNGETPGGTPYLTTDLALPPDLYILRWGLNDMYGPDYEASITDFATNLRAGLATIRASYPSMAILLITPNNTDGRNPYVHQRFNRIIKRASADYGCGFIDLYALFCQKPSSGIWTADGTHPTSTFGVMISDVVTEFLFPKKICRQLRSAGGIMQYRTSGSVYRAVGDTGATFCLTGANMLPDLNVSGLVGYAPFGTVSSDGSFITTAIGSHIVYGLNSNVIPGPTGCIRFIYKPGYQHTNAGNPNYITTSQSQYIIQHGNLLEAGSTINTGCLSLYYSGNNASIRLQYRRETDTSIPAAITLFAWNPAEGTEYEFEFSWDFTTSPGNIYVFLDGVLKSTTNTITWENHTAASGIGLSYQPTNVNLYAASFKNVQCFTTPQHIAGYTAIPMPRTLISSLGIRLGSSSSMLDTYDSAAVNASMTGFSDARNLVGTVTRTGTRVAFSLTGVVATAAGVAPFVAAGAIPSAYRPSSDQFFPVRVRENGADVFGTCKVESANGNVTFYKDAALGSFTAAAGGFYTTTLPPWITSATAI